MGYTIDFRGELKFNRELVASEIKLFEGFFGEDFRDHPEWGGKDLYYLAVCFNDDYTGIKHDESEKTYDLETMINVMIENINIIKPDIKLSGELLAQGEEITDRWILRMVDGVATRVDIQIKGQRVECPHCGEFFSLESE
jgi:hypothetical protein